MELPQIENSTKTWLFNKLVDESPDRVVTLEMVQGGNADLAETAEMVGMTEAETTQLTEALIMATVQVCEQNSLCCSTRVCGLGLSLCDAVTLIGPVRVVCGGHVRPDANLQSNVPQPPRMLAARRN